MSNEMAPETKKPVGEGYETTDAEVKPVLLFLAALGVLIIVAMAVMAGLYSVLESHFGRSETAVSPLVDVEQIPEEPRLQANPAEELSAIKAWEEEELNRYEWVDKDTGTFRIPIERAMKLIAETGLPARESGGSRENN